MERRPQSLLPEGTVAYKVEFIGKYYVVWKTTINHAIGRRLVFIYDPRDGLWATEWVRDIWKGNPWQHPHVSLFTLLYKKLEI